MTEVNETNGVKSRNDTGEDDEDNQPCGWGSLRPLICQKFRNPKWVLFCLCWAGATQGMIVNGFINVVISNLEKRYELSSTETGLIASFYDIATVLCLIPVSYFGGLGCKPRYIGIGVFIMGVGSFIFALPQFVSGIYQPLDDGDIICNGTTTVSSCDQNSGLSDYKYVFFLAQILLGIGASPLYTLGITYLDDNLSVRSSALYIGIYSALVVFGPAIGYLAGGAFLELYVDVDKVDLSSISLKPTSARYVGAWWIGFLISSVLALVIAYPLCGFPSSLPGSNKYRLEKEKQVYQQSGTDGDAQAETKHSKLSIGGMFRSFKCLLLNPTYVFLNLATACDSFLLAGFSVFMPKFVETQFSLKASTAATYVGFALIPAGCGGMLLGGYLVKRFDLQVIGKLRLALVLSMLCVVSCLAFLVHCDDLPFAGVNLLYGESPKNGSMEFIGKFEPSPCNSDCHCTLENYNPVCGVDGVMYYSSCYAGCQRIVSREEPVTYQDCSCISNYEGNDPLPFMATQGYCESQCTQLPIFMPMFTFITLLTFIYAVPSMSVTLRCVSQQDRSFAVGLQSILGRLLGFIPGPILFGKLIDMACKLWQSNCDNNGSCFFYNKKTMSYSLLAVGISGKALYAFFTFLSIQFYRPTEDEKEASLSAEITFNSDKIISFTSKKKSDKVFTVENDAVLYKVSPLNDNVCHVGFGDTAQNGHL